MYIANKYRSKILPYKHMLMIFLNTAQHGNNVLFKVNILKY